MKALVTGASSGLGKDFARKLDQEGYDLILVARREERLEELKKELHHKVKIFPFDLSKLENCERLIEEIGDEEVDLFINNAGFGQYGDFLQSDIEKEVDMVKVNDIAAFYLMKKMLQKMQKQKKGTILNVASAAAFTFGPKMGVYYATKSFLYRLTISTYEELRRKKSPLQVSVLAPGPVETEFNKVADVHFSFPPQRSEEVVSYTMKKLKKGKCIIIPSFSIRMGKFFSRFLSDKALARIGYHFQSRKER